MSTITDNLEQRRQLLTAQMQDLYVAARAAGRSDLSPGDSTRFRQLTDDRQQVVTRLAELREEASRDNAADESMRKFSVSSYGNGVTTSESTYRRDGEHSFFRDMFRSRFAGDSAAAERLNRNAREVAAKRAISTTPGAAGEFVPPLWLEDDFIAAIRPARATADVLTNLPLPGGTDVINLPKVNTGTAVALQGTQNTAIQQTDLTTTTVPATVYTIAGGQTFSVQLMDQSPISGQIDRVILGDLAADYARNIGGLVLTGTGTGQPYGLLNVTGAATVAYTDATPGAMGPGKLYAMVAKAIQTVQTSRFLSPTAIVMHPRRWAWLSVQTDAQNRAVILPDDNGPFNASGVQTDPGTQKAIGHMFSTPVVTDPNIPTTLGAGNNQDAIVVLRAEDVWLWESDAHANIYPQTYAQNASLFAQWYRYMAMAVRTPQSICVVSGTGLVSPVW